MSIYECIVKVEIRISREAISPEVTLTKRITLPFAPHKGIWLVFGSPDKQIVDVEIDGKIFKVPKIFDKKIFIDSVEYHIDSELFFVSSFEHQSDKLLRDSICWDLEEHFGFE